MTDERSLTASLQISPAIIEQNGWGSLVESGKFDQKTALACLEVTKADYLPAIKPRTMEEAIKHETPALSSLHKYRGDVIMNAVIHKLMYQLKDFYSVGREMSDTQVEILCDLIFENYYWITIAELKHFTRQAMSGKFGKVYDRMDGALVMEWLQLYAAELLETRRKLKEAEEIQQQAQAEKHPLPEWFTEKVQAIFEKMEANKHLSRSTMQFVSLEQYCEVTGSDYAALQREIKQAAKQFCEDQQSEGVEYEFEWVLSYFQGAKLAEVNQEWNAGKVIVNDKV